jgi:hypothetical protein
MAMPRPTPIRVVARPISTLGMQDHEVGPQRRDDRDRAVAVGALDRADGGVDREQVAVGIAAEREERKAGAA